MEMPELSRMLGWVAGSLAPLGLLLFCLHVPGMEVRPQLPEQVPLGN